MRRLLIPLLLIPSCLDAKPLSDKRVQDLTGVGTSVPSVSAPKDFYSAGRSSTRRIPSSWPNALPA